MKDYALFLQTLTNKYQNAGKYSQIIEKNFKLELCVYVGTYIYMGMN